MYILCRTFDVNFIMAIDLNVELWFSFQMFIGVRTCSLKTLFCRSAGCYRTHPLTSTATRMVRHMLLMATNGSDTKTLTVHK